MQLRRSARLLTAAGALLLAGPALTSCGFDYATDRPYTPGAGANERGSTVDVLGAVVVSAEDGSGTLIASFANSNDAQTATVENISGAGSSSSLQIKGFSPITVPAGGIVNLADAKKPIVITGDYKQGDFLDLKFDFSGGKSVEMQVPTVTDCYEYSGLDKSTSSSTPASACAPESPEAGH